MDSLCIEGIHSCQFEFYFSTLITWTLPFIQGYDWHSSMSTSLFLGDKVDTDICIYLPDEHRSLYFKIG